MRHRIGANLLWLVPGVVGGSEEYTMRLLTAFAARQSASLDMTLFVNSRLQDVYPRVLAEFETVVAPVSGAAKVARVLAESTWLPRAARRREIDLLHHLGGTMPLLRSVPGVVTVHDLQPFAMPEHFSHVKRSYLQIVLPMSVRRARRVVTLTEFTRRDLHERLGVDLARIDLVPSGVEPADDAMELARLPEVLERYGLVQQRYFLYPAITYPHKNHLVLLDALAQMPESKKDIQLVLTGGAAQMEQRVHEEAVRLGVVGRVVRTGRIPREDLDVLYHGAAALLFPSRFEGFGLPVLEAMVRGCAVIASDVTSLPEVIGDAGVLVDPQRAKDWSAAMVHVVRDDSHRKDLSALGRARAREFSWHEAAAALERVYRDVLESRL